MTSEKSKKSKTKKVVRNLPAKSLDGRQAKSVRGGNLFKSCVTGKHIAKAIITVR